MALFFFRQQGVAQFKDGFHILGRVAFGFERFQALFLQPFEVFGGGPIGVFAQEGGGDAQGEGQAGAKSGKALCGVRSAWCARGGVTRKS